VRLRAVHHHALAGEADDDAGAVLDHVEVGAGRIMIGIANGIVGRITRRITDGIGSGITGGIVPGITGGIMSCG
jgi:hypothetical protein